MIFYRLTEADNPTIQDEDYTYDAVGNRITSAQTTGDWTYNQNNELETSDDTTYEYDANGNMIRKTVSGTITNYIYNEEDRLTEVWNGDAGSGTLIATYYYDPFGRRLWKEVNSIKTYFVYADEGLVGEYDATGTEIRTYGYTPNSTWSTDPLFMKENGTYYFYQNDHLGTPQKLTAVNGSVVWSATYESFGKATVDGTSTVTNNLRFPGQYYDEETGLHYNYHRYYDPEIGRYLRVDPVGLYGSSNLYYYVLNNPLNFIDPAGLIWVTVETDNHGIKNWFIIIFRHFIYAEEGRAITHTDNALGSTRDVIQEWQHDKDNPCKDDKHTIGEKRKIRQTFRKKTDLLPPGLWDPTSEYYWDPPVSTRTYDDY